MSKELLWHSPACGVWNTAAGEPEDFTPAKAMGVMPRSEALNELGEAEFPSVLKEMKIEFIRGKTIIRIPLDARERIYGLGLQFMKVNHRGRTRFLRVNSDPRQDTGETHAPVPFYVSTSGYGILFNTSRIVTLYCGSCARKDSVNPPVARDNITDPEFEYTPVSDELEAVIPADGCEMVVFAGSSLLEIVRRYNLYFGGGVLPPKWGLGFWHRVPSTHNQRQVLEEALEYRKRGFPCDVIGLEPGWHSRSYPVTYEWSEERFPDPASFVAEMQENGFRVNLWEHAYVSPEAKIHAKLKPFSGTHTVWAGLAPDYSLPEVGEIIKEQHRSAHIDIGISGYKLDECDGSELTSFSWMFPAHAVFPSGHDGEQLRQMYGLLFQKTTAVLFKEAGRRTYGLVRASNAAASSLPYVLYSDLYDHREFVRGLCNASFCGLLWTPEVRGAESAEEWARRFQTVCFSPLAMINAWCDGTKPWSFPEAEQAVLKYVRLRMRLLPYFYSAFARYRFQGIPPFRAMHLEPGFDPNAAGEAYRKVSGFVKRRPWDVFEDEMDSQYMAGDNLLVAPLFAGQRERWVYLPEGKWYGFDSGEEYEGGGFIKVEAGLDELPLFVRDGGIIPMMPAFEHIPGRDRPVPLELRCYGTKPGCFLLYDDDGESFAFEQGQYRWIRLETVPDSGGRLSGVVSETGQGLDSGYADMNWVFMNRREMI